MTTNLNLRHKKVLIVAVLAVALALSCVALAGAKYAGYAYNNPVPTASGDVTNPYPGYLSWGGANAIYNRNVPGGTHMTTAHGDYVSSTTKCAVCHSAHRAYSASASVAGVAPVNLSLTSASGCVNCHTAWGSGGASKLIEWSNLYVNGATSGGPHNSFNCTSNCHSGGVHGTSTSGYNGMNAYMLGSDKDAAITAAFQAGNVGDNIAYNASWKPGMGGIGSQWFQAGSTGVPSTGLPPTNVGANSFAAAKSMATGYTCAKSGCHTSSQFAVNTWGFSEMHASNPRASGTLDMAFTGHGTGTQTEDSYDYNCGPCHPGSVAAGYRYAAASTATTNQKSFTYGCDQCHDMVGKATNTTAFPHGNRNIDVYQWNSTGAQSAITVSSGNLWMYQSDISTVDPDMVPDSGGSIMIYDHTQQAQTQTDKSWTVINNATAWSSSGPGTINDGTCLKCHVPVDSKSIATRGGTTKGIAPAAELHGSFLDDTGEMHFEDWSKANLIFLYK